MSAEQWRRVWEIYEEARKLARESRSAYIASATEDSEISREVLTLLDADTDEPDGTQQAPSRQKGEKVGRYELIALLGRGGMGEVYAAFDTALDRQVALKFLLPYSPSDETAVKRFIREAKAASALNHPNILTIHEVINSNSGLAIAMELVDGEPLSILRGSVLPWRQVVEIGRQAAAAIAEAHDQKIVHRDIKPENLMLRHDGIVKVLDFGLARSFEGKDTSAFESSVTVSPRGTLRYMSPEQLRNEPLTGASDVYSLGLVLYELIAGAHPFQSSYAWEMAHAIHTRDPNPLGVDSPETPAWLDELIGSMLKRDAALRPSARDVESALTRETWEGSQRETGRARPAYPAWAISAGVIVSLAAAAWSFHDSLLPWRMKAVPFTQYPGNETSPSFSPDGKFVAFAWDGGDENNVDVYTREVQSGVLKRITTSPYLDYSPTWSPAGGLIAFLRGHQLKRGASLFLVPDSGGPERQIADGLYNRLQQSLAWTPDGKWIIAASQESAQEPVGLFLISPADGTRLRLTRPPPGQIDFDPALAPNGRTLAFTRLLGDGVYAVYLLPLSSSYLEAGEPQTLPSFPNLRASSPQWTPDGKELIFAATSQTGTAIWRMRVPDRGQPPQPARPESYAASSFNIGIGAPSAVTHRLMFSTEIRESNLWRLPLGSTGQSSGPSRIGTSAQNNSGARISPDGSRMAFESMRTGSPEIWISNADGSNARALTHFGGSGTGSPAWSPDGRLIAFDSRADGRPHIYVVPADGGRPERLTETLADNYLPSWSRDGRWIYFCSSRSGTVEVWRQPAAGGAAEQITHGGGRAPAESPDGTALYYERTLPEGWALRRLIWSSGSDVEVIPELIDRAFEFAPGGLYYIPTPAPGGRFMIQFLDLQTGTSRLVSPIQRPLTRCLSLAPDGSYILYSQLDRWGRDLMLVENFH